VQETRVCPQKQVVGAMKKITIVAPGPLKHKFIAEGLNYYQTLIKRFAILEVKLPKLKGSYADPEKRRREEEALGHPYHR
jgi:hypothetical protein